MDLKKKYFIGTILINLSILAIGAQPRKPVDVPFQRNYVPSWSPDHIKYIRGGNSVDLVLDKISVKDEFVLCDENVGYRKPPVPDIWEVTKGPLMALQVKKMRKIYASDMRMKLVGGDSAGVVTAFYLSSQTNEHDEIDFEFLGNRTGQPYILQTNVFTGGKGDREQRIYLWFDPTKGFHDYGAIWNMDMLAFFVDNTPIRVFKNSKDLGVKYPFNQPMKLYSSLWNADDWATRGGLEKTNWANAPFIASYTSFHIDACVASTPQEVGVCSTRGLKWWDQPAFRDLDGEQYRRLRWVRQKFTIYNYCSDKARNPTPPIECSRDRDV